MFSGNVGRRDGMGFWGASRSGGSVTDRVGSVTGGCQVFLARRLVLLDGRNSAVFFPSNIWSACRQKSIETMPWPAGIREPARRLTSKPYTCVFLPSGSAEGMLSLYHSRASVSPHQHRHVNCLVLSTVPGRGAVHPGHAQSPTLSIQCHPSDSLSSTTSFSCRPSPPCLSYKALSQPFGFFEQCQTTSLPPTTSRGLMCRAQNLAQRLPRPSLPRAIPPTLSKRRIPVDLPLVINHPKCPFLICPVVPVHLQRVFFLPMPLPITYPFLVPF